MLDLKNTALVVVDVQGKLAQLMTDREPLFANLQRMVRGANALELPVLWVEQLPDKLGATIGEIAQELGGQSPISKASFSCAGEAAFNTELEATGCRQVLLIGIETHVCVYQTAMHLLDEGLEVELVADATSSRTAANRDLAIAKMQHAGVGLTSTEMVLFELMGTATHPAFRDIQKIIK